MERVGVHLGVHDEDLDVLARGKDVVKPAVADVVRPAVARALARRYAIAFGDLPSELRSSAHFQAPNERGCTRPNITFPHLQAKLSAVTPTCASFS